MNIKDIQLMLNSKIMKAGVGYTASNILLQGMTVFTLPIFTRLLTTNEYGLFGVFMSYAAILLPLISCSLHASLRSANITFKNEINEYTSSLLILYFFTSSILLLISLALPHSICTIIGLNNSQLVLLTFYVLGISIMTLYSTRVSLEYSVKKYFKLSATNTITSFILSLVLIFTLFRNNHLFGRLLGITISCSFVASISIIYFFKSAPPKINKRFWSFGLKYSFPLIPHGISQILLAQFDRIMINYYVGSSEAGIYTFGGTTRQILLVISNSLNTVWATWFFNEMSQNHIETIKRTAKEYSLFILLLGVSALFISPEILKLLGPPQYWDAKFLVAPIVLDSYIIFLYTLVVQAEYYKQKTKYVFGGTVIATVINITTNVYFIQRYGYIAAAFTTLFAYMCYLIFHVIIARKLIGFHIVDISQHVIQGVIMIASAAICLIAIDIWYVRWISMFIIDCFIALFLLRLFLSNRKLRLIST